MALHHLHPGERVQLSSVASPGDGKTRALVKTDSFETVQLVLHARDEISGHSVQGYATIQCLEGAVTLKLNEEVRLDAGHWVYLDRGQQHSLCAIEDSSLLLTILFD